MPQDDPTLVERRPLGELRARRVRLVTILEIRVARGPRYDAVVPGERPVEMRAVRRFPPKRIDEHGGERLRRDHLDRARYFVVRRIEIGRLDISDAQGELLRADAREGRVETARDG